MRVALVERIQNPFFTDLLYVPTGVSLLFHTLNPFNGAADVCRCNCSRGSARGLYLAYNSVVLFSFTLSGYGAFLLARWVLRPRTQPEMRNEDGPGQSARWWAALVAGTIFTFAPFHFAHLLGHMQVFAYQWVPFFVLALLRGREVAVRNPGRPRRWVGPALLAGVFFVLMALCDWYFALYRAALCCGGVCLARRKTAGAARGSGGRPAAGGLCHGRRAGGPAVGASAAAHGARGSAGRLHGAPGGRPLHLQCQRARLCDPKSPAFSLSPGEPGVARQSGRARQRAYAGGGLHHPFAGVGRAASGPQAGRWVGAWQPCSLARWRWDRCPRWATSPPRPSPPTRP